MMKHLLFLTFAFTVSVQGVRASTIIYSYDARHRLVAADYTEAQPDTHVTYQYDAANNVELISAITDIQWLRSFMIWLSSVFSTTPDSART